MTQHEPWHDAVDIGTRQVVLNTAGAMRDLHACLVDFESLYLSETSSAGAATSKTAQQIDFLSQSISEIEQMLDRLAQRMPDRDLVDARAVISPIRLGAIREKIAGAAKSSPDSPQTPTVDLFD